MTKRDTHDAIVMRDYFTDELNRLIESKTQADDLLDELSPDNQCDRILLINRRDAAKTKIDNLKRYLNQIEKDSL